MITSKKRAKKSLIRDKRFLPLFITQFFGAFNDNAFKNAFLIWFTFYIIDYHGMDAPFMLSLGSALFILPFFLFSATAGQLADKYEKSYLTRKIKCLEIILMILSAFCFYYDFVIGLLVILFAMGVQSTFFGPIKYSLLPEQLQNDELISANAYIEAGTFLSILLGTLVGGIVILSENGIQIIGICLVLFAITGYLASSFIPKSKIGDCNLKIGYNVLKETKNIIFFTKQNKPIWQSINAISWFWFVGVTFLTQFPVYTKEIIHGNEEIVTIFLGIFSIGIGIGSALCNAIVKDKVCTRIVHKAGYFMSIGIIIFIIASYGYITDYDLYIYTCYANVINSDGIHAHKQLLDIVSFFHLGFYSYMIIIGLLVVSITSGVYIVPLYAFMQEKAEKSQISRIIATNNVMNAIFMVKASLYAIIIFAMGFNILDLFISISVFNILACLYIKKFTLKS